MDAVVVGFRWHMAALSSCRLSPTYHDPVSPPHSSTKSYSEPAVGEPNAGICLYRLPMEIK